MGKYFGTDGFRGEANKEMTAEAAYKIGRYLGYKYQDGKIVIGKDTRRSSYMLEYALVSGILASGADAYLLHVTTTPSVSYTVRTDLFDCGIMVSASHNPYYDNGIKIIGADGEKLKNDNPLIQEIEDYLDGKTEIKLPNAFMIGKAVDYVAGRNRYIGHLVSLCQYSFKGYKVGLDCANGSAWHMAKCIFDALGATTYVIGDKPDGMNINDGVGSTHVEALSQFVIDNKLDVGFAYDGDADRCIAVDENGKVIDGDGIMYILAKNMKRPMTVVYTEASNIGLERSLSKLTPPIRTAVSEVGDSNVYDKMNEVGALLGGERSGHIIIPLYESTGDGILTSLKLMEAMIENKLPMSMLTEGLMLVPYIEENVRVSSKEGVLENSKLKAVLKEIDNECRDKGILNKVTVRASGTEPVIRVVVQCDDAELCEKIDDEIIYKINKTGYSLE